MKVLLLGLFLVTSCASVQDYKNLYALESSSKIGCSPRDIDVTNIVQLTGATTWESTCKETKFICTSMVGHIGSYTRNISCAKAL
jgi:hypothetical protein